MEPSRYHSLNNLVQRRSDTIHSDDSENEDDCGSISDKIIRYSSEVQTKTSKVNPLVSRKGHPDSMTLMPMLDNTFNNINLNDDNPYSSQMLPQ